MLQIVAIMNNETGEKYSFTLDLTNSIDFHNSIRVQIVHKNRLGWKMTDCKYSFKPFTEENDLKVSAWINGLSVEDEKARIESIREERFIL